MIPHVTILSYHIKITKQEDWTIELLQLTLKILSQISKIRSIDGNNGKVEGGPTHPTSRGLRPRATPPLPMGWEEVIQEAFLLIILRLF